LKLTTHISIQFTGISIIIVLLSIPVFYLVLQQSMLNSMDEGMLFEKQAVIEKLKTNQPGNYISLDGNVIIRPSSTPAKTDKIYNQNIYIPQDKETVTYRVLEFTAFSDGKPFTVRIQKSLIENEDLLVGIIGLQTGVLVLLFISLILINRKMKKQTWEPFYILLDKLKSYRVDQQDNIDLKPVKIKEWNDLTESLNELTGRNHALYLAQKEFTENASHELQTPLSIMQSNLDLLFQTNPLTEDQVLLMDNLATTNQRMKRLNNTLLLLAKIDNKQFADNTDINVKVLVENILVQFETVFQQKDIQLSVSMDDKTIIHADKNLIDILINNLVSNALRHSPVSGAISINLSLNNFVIANAATDGPLDETRLFKRFQNQQHTDRGNGLGLEICKKICAIYGHSILYHFKDNTHSFSVKFTRKTSSNS